MFEKSIKPTLNRMIAFVTGKWAELRIEYGILAWVASFAVPLKFLLFYKLMGFTANFFLIWLVTDLLTYLFFASFKNKWIPGIIYLLLTVLMFCDVTYSSFFNRYLSVGMIGAAGVVGNITGSIKEVIKPWFFLMVADALLILAALTAGRLKQRKMKESDDVPDAAVELSGQSPEIPDDWLAEELAANPESPLADELAANPESRSADELAANPKNRSIAVIITEWVSRHKQPVTALLIICILVFNFSSSHLITSLSNQEVYSYHIKDIVNKLTGNSMSEGSEYMSAVTDSYKIEKDGPLFGAAKGKNLIVIQLESFQNMVINKTYNGQEITPNLNRLIEGNTIYFDHYYQQIGSGNTSDAEFATNNSIYGTLASYTYKLYNGNYFKGLPKLLKEQGYETAVYHAYEDREFWSREDMYPAEGFDTFYGGIVGRDKGQYNMTEWMGWGLTDSEFFKQTVPFLQEMKQPFYSFIITLSNHHPFKMLEKYQFIDLLPEDQDTIFGNYLVSAAYTDYSIGQLIQELKDAGLYDNSIIALYGDHAGLVKTDEEIQKSASRFLGKEYDFDTMMNIPLIIAVPGADQNIHQTVSTVGGQMDFLPTIAYLMGFDSLDTIYLGHNLLTIDSGFVAEQTYMTKGSFFQDGIAYEMSRDGVFENGRAWNTKTGEPIPVKDCYDGYIRSMGIVNASDYILKNDVLRKIYEENQDAASAFSSTGLSEIRYPDEIATAGAPDKSLIGTNSLEALNASYDAGYRDIELGVCWTEDKEPVLLSSWQELGRYFDTDQSSTVTLDEFNDLTMRNGLTSMDYLDLAAWLKDHPDVTVYVQAERSEDYFMRYMGDCDGSIKDQLVAEAPGMVEYSGLYPTVLNIDVGGNSADQILAYIKNNHITAVSMSKESANGDYKSILNADCVSYIRDSESGILKRADQ
ncbi:MAG TPA: sulfatase-like hydrolase/transferase [Bacillota bacterium]|nr:sulfatase-like hydrolase/transferase [Bacillota bacterium]